MKRIVVTLISVLAASTVLAAKPNFSGTWKQNMEKSTGSTLQNYVNKIDQSGDTLKVVTTMNGSRGERTFEHTYTIGKEETRTAQDGDKFTELVKWDGNALVFDTSEKETNGTIDTRETWTLSDDGKTLTKVRHSHGPRGDRDQKYVLEKQ